MELTPGYKQTEVGVIPEDWDLEYVENFAHITTGSRNTQDRVDDGDYPFFVRSQKVERIDSYSFDGEAVLTAGDGVGTGKIYHYIDGRFDTHQRVYRISDFDERVNGYFFYLYFSSRFYSRIMQMTAKSSVDSVRRDMIARMIVPVPPTRAEQKAIAEALSDAEALVESLEQLLAKKRKLKQGAMQELLTGKKRLPEFSGEWKAKRLAELARILRGASPRPIDSPVWFDENSSIGWVRISDVTGSGMFLHQTTQRLSSLGVQNSRPVKSGSLIMSICATVGRPIITEIDVCIHDGFVVFEGPRVVKEFMYYMLKYIEGSWSKRGQTGSQMNLNTGLINRTEVLVPPTAEEQTAIAAILSDIDAEINALEGKLAKARQLKQGMMQELLTGRTRLI